LAVGFEESKLNGKKYELLVVIDDYSRYILKLHVFGHSPDIAEITQIIKPLIDKFHPKNILTDNNPFADIWAYWCFQEGVKAVFANPYYTQDKGKVERTIRNISAEELVYIFMNFGKGSMRKGITEGLKTIQKIYLDIKL